MINALVNKNSKSFSYHVRIDQLIGEKRNLGSQKVVCALTDDFPSTWYLKINKVEYVFIGHVVTQLN